MPIPEPEQQVLGIHRSLGMTPRFDKGASIQCQREAGMRNARGERAAEGNWDGRLAVVRQRLLLGTYDSDYVIGEVARRLLASGELGQRSQWAKPTTQHRGHVDQRGT
ncbi:MAG: hypothetical protein ACT4P6_02200 [Gemmatimonadaceae bacterium]